MKDTLVIGKIVGAHSIHGEIKLYPLTDDMDRFSHLTYFLVGNNKYEVTSLRIHKGNVLIKSKDIPDRNMAESLSGKYAEVLREDAVELEEGQYYIEDLKGITIKDISSDKKGIITDIIQNGAADIIEYKLGGNTYLMPYLNEYVESVDLENSLMLADLSKGLKA